MKEELSIFEIDGDLLTTRTFGLNRNRPSQKTSGVWALYGVEKAALKPEWKCLQVGQSVNMEHEILSDYRLLYPTVSERPIKNYVNQFGEKMFEYVKSPSTREILYNEIGKKYCKLTFISILKEVDKDKREEFEKVFAWMTHSLYWRNGGVYETDKNYSETELMMQKEKVLSNRDLTEKVRMVYDSVQELFREGSAFVGIKLETAKLEDKQIEKE